jgi:hypothetical protein
VREARHPLATVPKRKVEPSRAARTLTLGTLARAAVGEESASLSGVVGSADRCALR